jgi:hypothetical protein
VFAHVFPGQAYHAHDALEDSLALAAICKAHPPTAVQFDRSFPIKYWFENETYKSGKKQRLSMWTQMVSDNALTKQMAGKAAASGLTPQHLLLASRRDGLAEVSMIILLKAYKTR